MDHIANRKRLLNWMRQQLIGPAPAMNNAEHAIQGMSPLDRYPVGVLFPVDELGEGLDAASDDIDRSEEDAIAPTEPTKDVVEPGIKRRYVPPSSVGFSFFVPGNEWEIQIWFAATMYQNKVNEKDGKSRDKKGRFSHRQYQRIALGGDEQTLMVNKPCRFDVMPDPDNKQNFRAGIDVQARPYENGTIITVSLFNQQILITRQSEKWRQEQLAKALFEVQLHCHIEQGKVGDYPSVDYSLLDEESQELELQYQHKKIYAVGHGAAVQWRLQDRLVAEIYNDFMPVVEVPQVTADVASDTDSPVLSMEFLAGLYGQRQQVCNALSAFVDGYADWVQGQSASTQHQTKNRQPAGKRITRRMQKAVARMKSSITLLQNDNQLAKAFSLANQAMLDQMQQTGILNNKELSSDNIRWRPFQLAFLLTTLVSATDQDDEFRDLVDLIWFPTGGGKTEAYLGLIALVIVWRRLRFPEASGGTTSLMRYTLRLLTTQQFLRATRLICALEILRRQHPELGDEPITIGLWVGKETSPNTYQKALDIIERAQQGHARALTALVLEKCPWCNTAFKAPENFVANAQKFHFCCRNKDCNLGQSNNGILPCNVVDEALYQSPPTLLMATIDKFARLAWEERTHSFFGGKGQRPPELIVQDELHLIASALGSIAGIYEAALETILIERGIYPKYIASTATIRMAADQVRRLYGKDVAVFPPPGLNAENSYFAKTVPLDIRPGRTYVGYFAPMLNRQNNLGPLSASLLAAPHLVFMPGETDRDAALEAWWTQVVYHGSLKGVGNSHNSFNINIKTFYDRLVQEQREFYERSNNSHETEKSRLQEHLNELEMRRETEPVQLTSVSSATENANTFARLELTREKLGCIDAVLATNMVAVGLDVGRLALMVINGQPLTTAEYIQASSRVGRSDVPGVVFVNYYRDQSRSLSHYENFRPYHESFYRYVEPTSVTPFTYQARLRALHAGLVIVIRHSLMPLLKKDTAGHFSPSDEAVKKVVKSFIRRCVLADKEREQDIEQHVTQLINEWFERAQLSTKNKRMLCYSAHDEERSVDRLLYCHDDKLKGLWPTLNSMRNVENTGLLKIL